MSKRVLEVWSCGGGVQSVAIGALIVGGKLPMPDVAVIADTGRETGRTWAYRPERERELDFLQK